MKIVKYVFLLLLLTVVALTVFIATQEGKYDIKSERVIKAPKMVLYNYINDYKNWEYVGVLADSTTAGVFSYSENTSGLGAKLSWEKGSNTNEIQTTKVVANDSIFQKADIDNVNSEVIWSFKDTLKSTKVTIRMTGNLSFKEKAYAMLNGENMNTDLKGKLAKGLDNLNNFLVKELAIFDIKVKEDGLVVKSGTFYLGQAVTSKIEEINKKSAEIFPKLLSFMKSNKIIKKGSPFILYRAVDKANDKASYVVCMPIKDEMFTSPGSEYEGGKTESFTALKTTLKGDYSHLRKAWDKAEQYIIAKGLQENTTGQYIELYTKGVQKTKLPSEWVTDIYTPIGQPTITPINNETSTSPAQPVRPSVQAPATSGVRPSATTTGTKPATGTAPAASKPAGATSTGASKPATTGTAKPATGTVTPKPATSKPAAPVNKPVKQPATNP